ncbi:hypothetical protein EJB05_54096, partial [Eragrostis curvula]
MAGKASVALFLAVNLVVFAMASACGGNCPHSINPVRQVPTRRAEAGRVRQRAGLDQGQGRRAAHRALLPAARGPRRPRGRVCLCTAIKGNILGIDLNLPIDLSLILNHCGKTPPTGFKC